MAETTIRIFRSTQRGANFTVKVAAGETLRLPDEVVLRHGVYSDSEFSAEQWQTILTEAEELSCYRRLLRLIEMRPHTEAELRRKLAQRKFAGPVAVRAIAKAVGLGLVDDRVFARLFVEEKLRLGAVGRLKIRSDLFKRGVPRPLIDEAMAAQADLKDEQSESTAAEALATRKWASLAREPDLRKRKEKLLRFLAGRGFPMPVCYEVLGRLSRDCED